MLLNETKLDFKIDLAEKRSETNFAYQKLMRINQNDRELFDQVAALLIVNTFIPPEGWVGQTALSGGISNFSEMVSSTASVFVDGEGGGRDIKDIAQGDGHR